MEAGKHVDKKKKSKLRPKKKIDTQDDLKYVKKKKKWKQDNMQTKKIKTDT